MFIIDQFDPSKIKEVVFAGHTLRNAPVKDMIFWGWGWGGSLFNFWTGKQGPEAPADYRFCLQHCAISRILSALSFFIVTHLGTPQTSSGGIYYVIVVCRFTKGYSYLE